MRVSDAPHDQAEIRASVFDEISDAILIADDERRYVAVNAAACALFERTREELLALRIDDLMPSLPGVDVADMWRRFLAEGYQHGEFELPSPKGRLVVDYRARAHILPGLHMSVLRDVTERVVAMEQADDREQAFRRLADHLPHVVARFDQQRRHVFVNKAVERKIGVRPEVFLGKTNEQLHPDADCTASWRKMLERALAGEEVGGEFAVATRGDDVRTLEARIIPEKSGSDAIESALAVLMDVTEERRAQAQLRATTQAAEGARAVLDALLMAAPVGFAYLDRQLRFGMLNPCLASMNGLPMEAHIGKTPMELFPGLPGDQLRRHAEAVFETGKPQTDIELQGETPAAPGKIGTWIEHWYPVRLEGQVVGVGVVVEDATARRLAESQLRATAELRERLIAIVSHDLKNPLAAVVTAATMIGMHAEATHAIVGLANRIVSSGRRMGRLIEQLLDFVRVDQSSGIAIEPGMMNLASTSARVVSESGLAFPTASIELHARGDTAGLWDEDRIVQLLSNLIGNAVEHGDGSVRIELDGTAAHSVRVDIKNGGAAIPHEMLPAIFEPFRRAANGYARRHGLGLGLFISKSIVEGHGGSIDVRSGAGETTFAITLPRRPRRSES